MASRLIKKAKEDSLDEMIPVSKLEDFLRRPLNSILTIARISGVDLC
jgi:hypothetical protein